MRQVVTFLVHRPIWTNAFIIVTALCGILGLIKINQSFFPEMDPKTIIISVSYPGASPEEMEDGVTIKVEQALKAINGIDEINSSSTENFASITVKARQDADMDIVQSDVENAVNSINNFPVGAEKPIVNRLKTGGWSSTVTFVALTGDTSLTYLKEVSDKIERDLLNSNLISEVQRAGLPTPEIEVQVDEDLLQKYNMTIDEIAGAIGSKNMDITIGELRGNNEDLIVRSKNRTTTEDGIGDIIVRTGISGEVIRVRDIANVKYQLSETSYKSYTDGKPGISFIIKKTPEQDLNEISKYVAKYVDEWNEKEGDTQLTIQYDFNDMLQARISLLQENGIVGLILVLITLGLFLSVRLSAWVAFGIPFSFLGMVYLGTLYGISINMISLFGMIMVVGILVDDGIVIAENIYSHFEKGKSPKQAAIDGTMEVMPSVFTSVLTTMVAFASLLFLTEQSMMAEMGFVVIACLFFSLIEAFLILPAHLSHKNTFKIGTGVGQKIRNFFDKLLELLRNTLYAAVLRFTTKHYILGVLWTVGFCVFVIVMQARGIIGTTFFPELPPDNFNVEVAFNPGTKEDRTTTYLFNALQVVEKVNQDLIDESGGRDTLLDRYNIQVGSTERIGETGFHAGLIKIFLKAETQTSPYTFIQRVDKELRELDESKLASSLIIGSSDFRFGKPVSIGLKSENETQLLAAVDFLKNDLQNNKYLIGVSDNNPEGKSEIQIKVRPETEIYGLTANQVLSQLRQAFFGSEAQRIIIGTDEIRVWVRNPKYQRENISDLSSLKIKTPSGMMIPVSQLVEYEIKRGEVNILHRDGERQILVESDIKNNDDTEKANREIKDNTLTKMKELFPDVETIVRGQSESSGDSVAELIAAGVVVLALMFIIIVLNFNSWFQALLIIVVIPAGVFGGIFGHGIVGIPVSTVFSSFGFLALIGVLVNDAVVFLDTYNRFLKEGMNVQKAAIEAGISRFRPILLTSVTTVAGLLPIIAESDFQAQFLIPMAVSIAFGILFGTFFIQVSFPSLIILANRIKVYWKWLWTGVKPLPEEVEPAIIYQKKDAEE